MKDHVKADITNVLELVFAGTVLTSLLFVDENSWLGVAGIAATAYILADIKVREFHHDSFGCNDYKGISEFLYQGPRRLYTRLKNRGIYRRLGRGSEFV